MTLQHAVPAGFGAALLLVLVSSPLGAAPQPSPSIPAVWGTHDMIADLNDLPKSYTCQELYIKFRDLLVSIGARANMEIVPYDCPGSSPRVHLRFALPRAVPGTQLHYAEFQAVDETVHLQPGRPESLAAGDCALVRRMRELLTEIPVRVLDYRLTCVAPPAHGPAFRMSLVALTPASRATVQLAVRDTRTTTSATTAASPAPEHHG